jgi:hypothetical protein
MSSQITLDGMWELVGACADTLMVELDNLMMDEAVLPLTEDQGQFVRTEITTASMAMIRQISTAEAALCMVGIKMAREVNRPKRDNRVDGAGYFAVVDRIREREKQ